MTGTAPIFQMASSQRVSEATISPTNPRSGVVRFLRARKINPSPPERPTPAWPWPPSAATSSLFTRPPNTIRAASRVSASVMRRPAINSLFLPICFVPSAHQVHVLHRLPGRPFEQVVQTGNNHTSPTVFGQLKADVAVVGICRILYLRQFLSHPHHGARGVEIAEARFHLGRFLLLPEGHVGGGENTPRNRQQVRCENDLRLLQT